VEVRAERLESSAPAAGRRRGGRRRRLGLGAAGRRGSPVSLQETRQYDTEYLSD
jgi:hypothetical protein